MRQIRNFFHYLKLTDDLAVWGTFLFFLSSIFVPSVKIFYVVTFFYFSFLTLVYSFTKAIVYSAIPMMFVSVGQSHPILVVPSKAIVNHLYWEGRHIFISVPPRLFIWSVALFLYPVALIQNKLKIKLLRTEVFLVIFLLCGILSALYGSLMSEVSLIYVWTQLVAVTWFFYLLLLLSSSTTVQRAKLFRTVFIIAVGFIVFESFFVLHQMLFKSPVGVIIEQAKNTPAFGLGADEAVGGFRPFGLHAHPNGLANDQLMLISLISLLFLMMKNHSRDLRKMDNILLYVGWFLSLIIIALSLSRAAYVALIFISAFILVRHKRSISIIQQRIKKYLRSLSAKTKLLLIFGSFGLIFTVSNRLLSTIFSFTDTGGVSTRIDQYGEALQVFMHSPIWGIGDNMFIPTSYQLFPKGVMTYFPENVHNGFLLLLIERGAIGVVTYVTFLVFLLYKVRCAYVNAIVKTVIYSGIITSYIMMLFHPEYNFLSLFILFILAIIHIPYERSSSNENNSTTSENFIN